MKGIGPSTRSLGSGLFVEPAQWPFQLLEARNERQSQPQLEYSFASSISKSGAEGSGKRSYACCRLLAEIGQGGRFFYTKELRFS